ncbi:cytochrome P450 2F2-like protein [Labeo rohita]|uniref:Cytochrome P450 2F2-like protein n=2 Tax=Labeonini TaxID=2743697 RepID=A0A498MNB9_LABRO|nr:cytochrome P450 2F2-like protein [Labeo rohita]
MLTILVLLCLGACLLYLRLRICRPKNFPPGPTPVPFFGNLLQLDRKNPLKDFDKFAQRYGSIYGLFIGRQPAVVLTGQKIIREALITRAGEFAGRSDNMMVSHVTNSKGVIMANYGEGWREHRRFALTTLRNFGLGKKSMEQRILEELYEIAPALRILPLPFRKAFQYFAGIKNHILKVVDEHKKSCVTGEPRDLIDCYLEEMEKRADQRTTFDDSQMVTLLFDLFLAGTETTSNTLRTLTLYLMTHTHIQEQCQREIDEVLGDREHVTFEDRNAMPYVQAVIHEGQRVGDIAPLSMFHTATTNTQLRGYNIPKFNIRRPQNFPPGPTPVPFFGNLLQLDRTNPLKDFDKFAQRYGSIYGLFIGRQPAVVLTGQKIIREALITRAVEFAGRSDNMMVSHVTNSKGVIMANYGEGWREHRRFALTTLRNFGLGKKSMEQRILEELYEIAPVLRIFPLPFRKAFQYFAGIKNHILKVVDEHKKSRVTGEPRDLIDCYLEEMEKRADQCTTFDDSQMAILLFDLFLAGTETTSNTLRTLTLYLMTHIHIQEQCQREIDEVLGDREHVTFEDRNAMPYVQAVIHEGQRVGDIVPLSMFHTATTNTQLQGYNIPKGTIIIPYLSSALREESQWKFPHEFNPQNFLNDKGEFVKPDAFMPFSVGPRMCLGENLARMELFLILVTVLRRFRLVWPEDAGEPDFKLTFGGTQIRHPKNFPPGPTPVPFFGNFLQLDRTNPLKDFNKFAQRYGSIYGLFIGRQPAVVLTGQKMIREALITRAVEFAGRSDNMMVSHVTNSKGVIMADYGEGWRENLRFALTTLRNFGLGKKSMEQRILEEVKYICSHLEESAGKSIDPQHLYHQAASNIIASIIFGSRFNYQDEYFQTLITNIEKLTKIAIGPWAMLYEIAPALRIFPLPFCKAFQYFAGIKNHILKVVDEHKKSRVTGEPRDLIDCYLEEMEKRADQRTTFDDSQMVTLLFDLFAAGTETTSNTLRTLTLYLMTHTHIQEQCQREIDEVLGDREHVTFEDRNAMPYVQAVIHEGQRVGDIAPLSMFHTATTNTQLRGYNIPKLRIRRYKNFPPGPTPVPFFGNLLQLDRTNPLKDFDKFAQRYGSVYGMFIGRQPAVVLTGQKIIREALITQAVEFAGRSDNMMVSHMSKNKGVVLANYGESWREHRRFALTTLRNFGLGKKSMEQRILEELYEIAPVLRIFPLPFRKAFQYFGVINNHILKVVDEHKKSRVTGEPRDLIDCYLEEIEKRADQRTTFDDSQMAILLFDLFAAGTETTSSTLRTITFYLMTHTHIQEQCQREIDEVLGDREHVTFEDRNAMPYVQAVIHEGQRFGDVVPLGLFHTATTDTQLRGYNIPKGTIIIPYLSSALREESQWKFPHEFNPQNFLNDKGEFVKPDAFMPFSVGPRMCLGENLARMELFLILVTVLRRFRLVWPEDAGEPDFKLTFGGTQGRTSSKIKPKR